MNWRLSVFAVALALAACPARAAEARHPVLMISIDGLRPDAVLEADRHGLQIPVLRRFLKQGSYAREVVNVNPTVTNPNHTTLVTGVLPAEHGIYNNRPFAASAKLPETYQDYAQIKAPTIWHAAKAAGLTTASLFWPVTRNAPDIDFNVTDGAEEDDAGIARQAVDLIERHHPDLLTVHFVALDHEEHKSGPFSPASNVALERIDTAIGRVVAAERQARPNAVIMVVSDHGFAPTTHQMNLNAALVRAGLITLNTSADIASWRAFAWYVGGSAMIVLKDPADEAAAKQVEAALRKLASDPANGIERVLSREQFAGMGYAPQADYVVAFKAGYRMGNGLTGPILESATGGAHGAYSSPDTRRDMHSSLFVAGPGIAAGKDLGAVDMRQIAPTVAKALGTALPSATIKPLSIVEE